MSKSIKAMDRPMKDGKMDQARRMKMLGYIESDLHLVKHNGYTIIFDPSESKDVINWNRRLVLAKNGRGGVNIFGPASEQMLQDSKVIS